MSTSNTLTKNDLKNVLEKISISAASTIDVNDMTQSEIEDFIEELNVNGKSNEYRKLLWTNPTPAASFAAQTISLDLSDYNEVEIFIAGNSTNHNTSTESFKLLIGKGGLLNISANVIWWRYVTPRINGVEFGSGYQTPTYGSNGTADNSLMVPFKIYGIKYSNKIYSIACGIYGFSCLLGPIASKVVIKNISEIKDILLNLKEGIEFTNDPKKNIKAQLKEKNGNNIFEYSNYINSLKITKKDIENLINKLFTSNKKIK